MTQHLGKDGGAKPTGDISSRYDHALHGSVSTIPNTPASISATINLAAKRIQVLLETAGTPTPARSSAQTLLQDLSFFRRLSTGTQSTLLQRSCRWRLPFLGLRLVAASAAPAPLVVTRLSFFRSGVESYIVQIAALELFWLFRTWFAAVGSPRLRHRCLQELYRSLRSPQRVQ